MVDDVKVLVTGTTGFLGHALMEALTLNDKISAIGSVRRLEKGSRKERSVLVGELDEKTNWLDALTGVGVVIHVAARAHITRDVAPDPLAEYRRVNVAGTLHLARQAAALGVRRLIFISSIGVNGNINERPFTVDDPAAPADLYALSKWEAEQGLWKLQKETGIEIVIIRPPLVYGHGAPGTFGSLVRWIENGFPLPLGSIKNKRSLIGIDNLVDLIIRCIFHPGAANQLFIAGDGEDISTTDLLRNVGNAMGKPVRLIPISATVLKFSAAIIGKKAVAQRLLGSLQVDISKTCALLDWTPPYTMEEGLMRCFLRTN